MTQEGITHTSAPFLAIRSISYAYGRHKVLSHVSCSLAAGQLACILGPNGSGKSTFLRLAALILKPQAGSICLDGADAWARRSDARNKIGYVPQDIALFEELSVRDNLLSWARGPKAVVLDRMDKLSQDLDLAPLMKQRVSTLSGGMKRRVNLAVALMEPVDLLVLDEPFSGVDATHRQRMTALLKQETAQGTAVLVSAHRSDPVLALADQRLRLSEGQLLPATSQAAPDAQVEKP